MNKMNKKNGNEICGEKNALVHDNLCKQKMAAKNPRQHSNVRGATFVLQFNSQSKWLEGQLK